VSKNSFLATSCFGGLGVGLLTWLVAARLGPFDEYIHITVAGVVLAGVCVVVLGAFTGQSGEEIVKVLVVSLGATWLFMWPVLPILVATSMDPS
jgi:hypothetical protein